MTSRIRPAFNFLRSILNSVFFWFIWIFVGNFLLRIYFRISAENLPSAKGGFIVAANHSSLLDGLVLQTVLPRRLDFLLSNDFFKKNSLRWFFRSLRMIPIHEGGGNKDAIAEAGERLRKGKLVGVFPEGGVSTDGRLGKGQPGAAMLSEAAQVPVVPAAILGTFEAFPRGASFPRPKKVRIRFGEPIAALTDQSLPRRQRYQKYTAALMQSIAELAKK